MDKKVDPKQPGKKPAATREDRLKAALKANLSRRKTQARARANSDASPETMRGETGHQDE